MAHHPFNILWLHGSPLLLPQSRGSKSQVPCFALPRPQRHGKTIQASPTGRGEEVGRFPRWSHRSTHRAVYFRQRWRHAGLPQILKHQNIPQSLLDEIYRFGLWTFPNTSSPHCGTDGLLLRHIKQGCKTRTSLKSASVQPLTVNKFHLWLAYSPVLVHTATKPWCSVARANYHLKQTTQWKTKEHISSALQSSHILMNDNHTGIKWPPPPRQPKQYTEQQKQPLYSGLLWAHSC